jgi:hypothetical protein
MLRRTISALTNPPPRRTQKIGHPHAERFDEHSNAERFNEHSSKRVRETAVNGFTRAYAF